MASCFAELCRDESWSYLRSTGCNRQSGGRFHVRMGPGVGDESTLEAEHADEPEVEAILGFRPTHAVNVSACCNREIDHVATALLTAAVMDVIGGVVNVELLDGQASVVAGLPGVLGIAGDDWMALGSAEFLRAWLGHPAFRLVK